MPLEESAGVGQVVDGEKPDSTRLLTCHAGNYRGRRPVRGKMSNVLPSCKKYASAFLEPLCKPRKLATVSCTP